MTEILHIKLEKSGQNRRRFSYYCDNHLQKERSTGFPLQEIQDLIKEAKNKYDNTLTPAQSRWREPKEMILNRIELLSISSFLDQ